jgi:hypothetical protein
MIDILIKCSCEKEHTRRKATGRLKQKLERYSDNPRNVKHCWQAYEAKKRQGKIPQNLQSKLSFASILI